MHSPKFYLYVLIAVYSVCALLMALWVHILTRRGRSCRRKTCTYYVRYIPSGDPLLMHEDFHFWESECSRLTDEVEQHIHRGYVPPLGLCRGVAQDTSIAKGLSFTGGVTSWRRQGYLMLRAGILAGFCRLPEPPRSPVDALGGTMYTIRVYFEVLGGHTHMHIRVGKTGCTLGGAGDIVMTNEEFEAWRMGKARLEFVEKEQI